MDDRNRWARVGSQRLHLFGGTPWDKAVREGSRSETALWTTPPEWEAQDLMLTVLDCHPRMLLCLERAETDGRAGPETIIQVCDIDDYANLPGSLFHVPSIEKRIGSRLPAAPETLSDVLADAVLAAIADERVDRTRWLDVQGLEPPSCKRLSTSGLKAALFATNGPVCFGCEFDFGSFDDGRGEGALDVHRQEATLGSRVVVPVGRGQAELMCKSCHHLVHGFDDDPVTVTELRFAHRPPCPDCKNRHALRVTAGRAMTGLPIPEDEVDDGCIPDFQSRWQCRDCGTRW